MKSLCVPGRPVGVVWTSLDPERAMVDPLAAAAVEGQANYASVCGSRLGGANTACPAAGRDGALAWVAALAVGLAMVAAPGRALAQRPMGTDVSHYQGTGINWVNVKNAGVTFAWCKATEATTFKDSTFTLNQTNAKAAGVFVGAYHFARPSRNPNVTGANSADSEAAFFWGVVSNYVKTGGSYLVPMLDWEDPNCTNQLSATTLSSWVNEWCNTVSNYARLNGAPGMKPIVYTGTWYSRPSSTYSGLTTAVTIWPGWIAAYPSNPNPQTGGPSDTYPWSKWTVWQYADTNWSGGDSDVFNGTAATLVTTLVIGGSPPVITNQPVGQIVMAGANPSFTVGASGAALLSYQWRLNGANITGATASSYTRNNVQLAEAGSYSVVVTNVSGSATSSNAVLIVYAPPSITVQPANAVTGLGLSATLLVTATGTAPLSYQWQFDGANLSAATASSLTIINAWPTNAGTYAVVVTNLYGTTTSSNALLTVQDPYITTQPQSLTVAVGALATFTVGAVGTAPLTYSWRKNGVALTDGGNISGSATSTLALASVQVEDVATYSVVVSNINGWMLSSDATLMAAFAPSIATQPASQRALAGSTAALSVSVLGPGPMTYQWRKDGTNMADGGEFSGSATASLIVSNFQAGEMGNYSVAVANTNGSATSSNALVTLWPLAAWGAGTTNSGATPNYGQAVVPAGLSNVVAVAGGLYHSLALRTDGTVAAWGAGQTNKGTSPHCGQAVVPGGLNNVLAVAGGYYHSLALMSDGTVMAWGAGTTNTGVSPHYGQAVVPDGLSNVVSLAAGGYHALALKADGTVIAWGAGTTNTGVNPHYGQAMVPDGLSNVVALAAGGYHTLTLKADGTVVAWGAGASNTGSSPDYGQSLVPAGLSNVVMTAAGGYHSLALKLDGTVVAWGDNTYGQTNPPAGLSNVVAVAAGRYNSLALMSDGTVMAWGAGTNNTGTTPNLGQAIVPALLTNVIAVASGGFHTLVLEGDGTPSLTVQPANQTVSAGANVIYAAMAVGSQPMSYQWQVNGTNIPGATTAVLSLANVQLHDAGQYGVIVSNAVGAVASSNAALTVLMPTGILSAPAYRTDGVFQFNLTGTAGSNYVIEASTNLTDWTPLATNTSPFTFADTNAVNVPLRFYRARLLP